MTDPTPQENIRNALQVLHGLDSEGHLVLMSIRDIRRDLYAIRERLQAALAQLDGRTTP